MISRTRLAVPLLLGLALVGAPLLSGCSSQVQSLVGDASGGAVDIGGTTVPADFPAEVPLADGEVKSGSRVGTGTGKVWNVTVAVAGADAPSAIADQFAAAGFASTSDVPGIPDTGGTAGFADGAYAVAVVVDKNTDGTFTANYTVTAVPK